MYYPDELIEEIRMKNDIVDVISGYVNLKRKGNSYFGLCPFHNEKTASFSVTPGKQMYYCFGCGAGGNVYTFVMNYENFTFLEAVKFLAGRAGVALPEVEYSKEQKAQADLKSVLREIQKQAAAFYYYQLRTDAGKQAYEYLTNRGLKKETMQNFGLGYAVKYSDTLHKYLKKKGHSDEILKQSGLFQADEKRGMYDKFWNRVMFPIMDVNGRVIGFGGRVMGNGKPKYLNSPETKIFDKSHNLYGLHIARTSRKKALIVCEGYMDVIAMHQAGFTNAVASLGTALTSGHASLLHRYTEEILLTYDSDEAGVRAALRGIPILKAAGLHAKVVDLKPYKDPDEFIQAEGTEAFEDRLRKAMNGFLFEIQVLENRYDLTDPQGKTDFYKEIAKRLLEFTETIERENYMESIARRYGISYEDLRKMVNTLALQGTPAAGWKPPKSGHGQKKSKETGVDKAQKWMLTWLASYPELFDSIAEYLGPDDFVTPLYHTVAKLLFAQYEQGEVNPARLLNQFTESEEQMEVAALFNADIRLETDEERQQAVTDTVCRIKRNSIDYRTSRLSSTDMQGLQQILEDKKALEEIEGRKVLLHISFN